MKRFLLPVILAAALFLADTAAHAQRGRIYRGILYIAAGL